jgi:hypothetical protein
MGYVSDSYKVGVRKLQIIGVGPPSKNKNETVFEEEFISDRVFAAANTKAGSLIVEAGNVGLFKTAA